MNAQPDDPLQQILVRLDALQEAMAKITVKMDQIVPDQISKPTLLTLNDVADRLLLTGRHRIATVKNLIRDGHLRAIALPGVKTWRVAELDFRTLLQSHPVIDHLLRPRRTRSRPLAKN